MLVVRAPHLAVTWTAGGQTLVDGVTGRVYRTSPAVLRVLDAAGQPLEPGELGVRAGVGEELVGGLVEAGLLVPAPAPPDHWSTFELIVQRMSGGGGRRAGLHVDGMPPARRDPGTAPGIPLPRLPGRRWPTIASVLRHRRSHREFGAGDLALAELGELLLLAAAVQRNVPASGVSFRPHPSAGGRHPLEISLVALHVAGLARGVYRYDPFDRLLREQPVDAGRLDRLPDEIGAALDSDLPVEPAVLLLVTAVFARTLWKYEAIGLGLVYKDAGALLQTLHLAARGLGLAGCALNLREEAMVARWLGADPLEESLVAAFALGHAP
jgi:SagB-type dehydrogenase family enzyme